MTDHEVLVAARNRIDRDGWRQLGGDYARDKWRPWRPSRFRHPTCAGLAMSFSGDVVNGYSAHRAFIAVNRIGGYGLSIAAVHRWNDAPGRTREEVLAALDRTIAATAPEPDTSFLAEPEREEAVA